ncbi:MAG: GntR family transcriptional regulator [Ruminococcus sp.]|jgi:GntR family transcriptional regulator|nr:GntR family transcriptional regulator [Ruminococcus sp.]
MNLSISNRSSEPLYEQLKTQIRNAIISGELLPDEQLPTIRELAQNLKVSVITTTRAYSDLEAEGFVVNRQGKGCFVLPLSTGVIRETALSKIGEYLSLAVAEAKRGKVSESEFLETLKIIMSEENYDQRV